MALPLVGVVLLVLAAWAAPTASAADRVYWGNAGNDTISFANLDGSSGGGQLNLSGATPSLPYGLAIAPQGAIGKGTVKFEGPHRCRPGSPRSPLAPDARPPLPNERGDQFIENGGATVNWEVAAGTP